MSISRAESPQSSPVALDPARFFSGLALAVCVTMSGAAVMIYEFLAVRILARDFGSSFEIWAAEITVCMAGLAIGYSLGGRMADRLQSWWPLGFVMAFAGLTAFPMERLALGSAAWLFSNEEADPQWWWPLFAAGVSTFAPILALGTVMPQAIRLHVSRFDKVGASAGWIATVSTVGSIAGVLLITFLLLPRYGVRQSLFWVSVIMTATGGAVMAVTLVRRMGGASRAAGLVALLALLASTSAQAQQGAVRHFDQYSPYHHILVEDIGDERLLLFDNTRQSKMSISNPVAGGFEYSDFFHVPMIFNPAARSVLFVGLGGGTGPKAYLAYYPAVQIDAVEIDAMVESVAREFFMLPKDPRLKVSIADGRVFLRRSRKKYDAILMDAYSTGPYGLYLPFHLTTVEFFRIARERLNHGGTLLYNVVETDRQFRTDRVQDVLVTLEQVFEAVYVFRAASSLNTVMVAVKLEPGHVPRPENAWPAGPVLEHPIAPEALVQMTQTLVVNNIVPVQQMPQRVTQYSQAHAAPRRGRVLTDDFAPTDLTPR